METAALQLVLILCCFPGLHSATVPYPHFHGTLLANHSFVDLGRVQDNASGSLHCHTDLYSCCTSDQGEYRGSWFFPNGSRVEYGTFIYEVGAVQKVELRRRNGAILSPTGLYRCDIQTIASRHFPTGDPVYVGLYPPNEGDVQILGDLTLTVSSVLSGTNPLITLTCISTGGPATTVTWTRDSTIVTQGTVTVLDDPVTAQYTHTLTVSIEGDYTCTVSNNKPSTASASVTLRGPETPIVRVVSTTATSVTLSCIDPSDAAVISHVLHWQGDLPVACSDTNEGTTAFHTDANSVTVIDGLEEGIAYKMSVTSINVVGSSKVSETFTAVTKEAAPTGSPTSVMGSAITATSISLRWEEVPCLHRNGEITGYTVLVGNGRANRLVEVAGDLRETNISGLAPSTEYNIQVAAMNSAGTGSYSDGRVYKTRAATYAGGEDALSCTCPKADNTGAVIGGVVVSVALVITAAVIVKVAMIMLPRKYGKNSTHDRKSPTSAPITSNSNETVLNEAYNAVERVEESDSVYEEVSFEASPSSTI